MTLNISLNLHIFFKIDWINEYHAKVFEKVGQYLIDQGKMEVVDWLKKQTAPLG